jgi:hypothetical protein
VGRPARLQPIDRAFQRCPHWTLGTPSGWPKAMTSDLSRRRPRRRQPLASIMACVSAAWVTYQAARRRPPYQPFRFGVQGMLGATITLLIANQAQGQDAPRSMVLQRMTTSGESMVGLTARMMAPNGVTRGPQPLPAAPTPSLPPLGPRTVTATPGTGSLALHRPRSRRHGLPGAPAAGGCPPGSR